MLKLYQSELVKPFKSGELILNQVCNISIGKRRAHVRGLVYGLTNAYFLFACEFQFILFWSPDALCYYFGAWLLVNHPGPDVTATNIMKVLGNSCILTF